MLDTVSQMLWPLLACFILVGIHAYLGIHVIARKVIFVDLALAQIAGLGAVYGVFLGLSFESDVLLIKLVSVVFTLFGAVLFSMTRTHNEHVPHEAIIGIIYAAALSMTVLMTANLPHGADEVQQMLAGSILWVTPHEVMYTGLLYSAVGLFHWFFRKQFFLLSNERAAQSVPTFHARLWDFWFYATFGVVVTSSVGMGGVLLVFGFLVIPSVMGVMLASSTRVRLLIGWGSGLVASIIGVWVSYYLDLPSGPTIVVILGAFLAVVTVYKELIQKQTRYNGIIHIIFFICIVIALYFGPKIVQQFADREKSAALRHRLEHDNEDFSEKKQVLEKMLISMDKSEVINALGEIELLNLTELLPKTLDLLFSKDASVREKAVRLQESMNNAAALAPLRKLFEHEQDDFIKIGIGEAVLGLGDPEGFSFLATLLNNPSELVRSDALDHMKKWLEDISEENLKKIVTGKPKIIFDAAHKKYIIDMDK